LQCIKVKQRPNPKTYSVSRLNNVKTKDLQCIKVKQRQNQRLTVYQG